MGLGNLSLDERARVRWVINWINRMAEKYGGTVYGKDGKSWDWGQALCVECYGPGWNDIVPDTPTWSDIAKAKEWEKGNIPEWVSKNNEERDECEKCGKTIPSILSYSSEEGTELYMCRGCIDKELHEAVLVNG